MDETTTAFDSSTNREDDRSEDGSIDIASSHGDCSHNDPEVAKSGDDDTTPKLAHGESKAVGCFRILFLLAFLATATAVSLFIYNYMRQDEKDEFEAAAASHATKLMENFHTALGAKLSAINTLSVAITSYSLDQIAHGEPGLPFVVMPNFAVLAADTRVQAQAVIIVFSPLVRQGQERQAWETYAEANRNHIFTKFINERTQIALEDERYNQKGRPLDEIFSSLPTPQPAEGVKLLPDGFNPRVHYLNGTAIPEDKGDWVMPLWDISPSVPIYNMMNYDASRHFVGGGAVKAMYDHHAAILDLAIGNLTDAYDTSGRISMEYGLIQAMGQYRYEPETEYTQDPLSAVVYPVFDNFDPFNRQVAGMLTTNIYWKLFFQNVLPEDARGIIVVLENTFEQTFTYRVDGLIATFLGDGDLHDTAYDYLGQTAMMGDYIKEMADPTTQSYSAAPLLGEYGDYKISVYPSSDTEADHLTNEPIFYTIIVGAVFLLTAAVFVLYDYFSERRQRVVMDNAIKSGALISSLFPSNIRDRLYEEAEAERKKKLREKKDGRNNLRKTDAERIPWRVQDSTKKELQERSDLLGSLHHRGPAIADRFEHSTVLFADLAGFTKWSASRDPQAVFQLLETIYHAFDKIADKRKVYKIETIGDCYVAVTGVPEEQVDHAPRMVKFARNIMLKMRVLKMQLAEKLGDDTIELELRIGLHSGSVTAGVLRGKKSRFQLFGDTVNTAARMESNGIPGRIHVSQAVADELKARGYEGWLQRRADTIDAKGKGEMQTYWIVGSCTRSSSGYSGDNSYTEGTSTRFLLNDETSTRFPSNERGRDLLAADGMDHDDDEFMLDLHEKLQHRMHKKANIEEVAVDDCSTHSGLLFEAVVSEA